MRFGKTKGEIWVEKGDFRGDLRGLDLVWESATPPTHTWERFPKKISFILGGIPLLKERRSVSRLSAESDDEQCDGKGEDPVDKDKELGVVELALVAQGVLVLGGHDFLLQIPPRAVRAQQPK